MTAVDRRSRVEARANDRFGAPIVLRQETETFDPATRSTTTAITDNAGRGRFIEYRQSEIDGTLVQANDRRVRVTGIGVTPAAGDVFFDGADVTTANQYRVVAVVPVTAAMSLVAFDLQLRRG